MKSLTAFNFKAWIYDHRHMLKPPVCNQQVFEENDFIVMVVGGPNSRTDYHYDEGPEFFYQLEGEMLLRTIQEGKRVDITVGEGEILLLPPKVPHSPQRFENTVGLIVGQLPPVFDRFYESETNRTCDKCATVMPQRDSK